VSLGFRTVAAAVRVELPKIKGSRFIAHLVPAADVAGAESVLDEVRRTYPDAGHHCWAYRLGREGGDYRYHDDGEPSGTAGRPIFQHLEGQEMTQVMLVVVRYFGGTKLGAGGLVRAYGEAAAAALSAAEIVERVITVKVRIEHRYEDSAAMSALMTARAVEPKNAEYADKVRLVFEVPAGELEEFVAEVRERTGGRVVVKVDS